MTELFAAAKEIFHWLDPRGIRGCLNCGLVLQRRGEPRLTRDADLTVFAEIGSEQPIFDICLQRFAPYKYSARVQFKPGSWIDR